MIVPRNAVALCRGLRARGVASWSRASPTVSRGLRAAASFVQRRPTCPERSCGLHRARAVPVGCRSFAAAPANAEGPSSKYLELSQSTVERLESELASHGELLDRMEHDFASLTNKDHKRFGILEGLVSLHDKWTAAHAGYTDALEMIADLRGSDSDSTQEDLNSTEQLSSEDAEMLVLAEEEAAELKEEMLELERSMWELLLPRDEADANNVLLETKAGVGGAEAALFTEEIFGMYRDFAQRVGFKFEPLEIGERAEGGYRYATASIQSLPGGGNVGPYEMLKFESGVHRVQRVPETETQGRVHTSAVSVIVLPEPEDVDFDIAPADIKKDVFRASGAGGQHVNTTESAVRLTHLPTGIKVAIQDERSQHSNYQKALKILRARVFDDHRRRLEEEHNAARQEKAGSGDRSEKVRTYNYHRDEVTDHRVRVSVKGIPAILRGGTGLDTFIENLSKQDQERRISQSSSAAPSDSQQS